MLCQFLEKTTDPTERSTLFKKVSYKLSYSVLGISPGNEISDS